MTSPIKELEFFETRENNNNATEKHIVSSLNNTFLKSELHKLILNNLIDNLFKDTKIQQKEKWFSLRNQQFVEICKLAKIKPESICIQRKGDTIQQKGNKTKNSIFLSR